MSDPVAWAVVLWAPVGVAVAAVASVVLWPLLPLRWRSRVNDSAMMIGSALDVVEGKCEHGCVNVCGACAGLRLIGVIRTLEVFDDVLKSEALRAK